MYKKKDKKKDKESGQTVDQTIKDIRSRFGDESIMKMSDQPLVDIDKISTGSFGLDLALGIGGLPRGRMVEISGPESSGKTTLALHVIAEAQKDGGECAFIDAEHAMDPEYAKKLGVDTGELFVSQPDNGEQALEILESLVRSNKFAVVVVDSVATLTPKDEIEGDMGAHHVGRQARLMSQALRKLVAITSKSKTLVVFINQIRMMIGIAYGNPEFTPGGKALKFYSTVRLDIRRTAHLKKGEDIIGGRIRVKVTKNKVAPPFKQTEFDLYYGEGISKEREILVLGDLHGVITKVGASLSYNGEKIGHGNDRAVEFLKENPEIAEKIIKDITEKLK